MFAPLCELARRPTFPPTGGNRTRPRLKPTSTRHVPMLIVQVFVHVLPQHVDAFLDATLDNARHSVQEPGVVRFDVIQQDDDPTRFALIEIYRDADAPAAHKATAHYARWRDAVEPMMAEPRRNTKYRAQFPAPAQWEMSA
jgi:(4S)-4-hydroxy-5-phosphonooxypentane-2,3-dione isomerase